MDALTSGRLWVGIIIGVVGLIAWQRYQSSRATA